MSETIAYRVLAKAFAAEDVDTLFVLTGDGNMHFAAEFAELPDTLTVHVRHEHCAVAAATAYAMATNKVGVASVTCGPGLTQIITALPAGVRASVPLVVFAGEAPINARFYNQEIDQAPIVTATGAYYIRAHSLERMLDHVREAFHIAQQDRCPVVIGIPYDLQKAELSTGATYVPSSSFLADGGRPMPDASRVEELVIRLATAKNPILIGGRGALRSGAKQAMVDLADRCGALLANTLPVRGLFDDHTYSLGVVGGYASDTAREAFAQADLVVAVGASLSYYTKDGGKLFPNAFVVQIDTAPRGLNHGMRSADLFLTCDAKEGVRAAHKAVQHRLGDAEHTASICRTPELAEKLATAVADSARFEITPGQIDPRTAMSAVDSVVPWDWDFVTGAGHQAYFNSQIRGRPPERFLTVREFGAVGNGLSYALGVAAARRLGGHGRLVLIEGDGGLLMHVQELETIKRLGLRMLICVMNDGAYGSEIHKLRADGLSDQIATFGRTPIHHIAQGFGLRGVEISDLSALPQLFAQFDEQTETEIWNFPVSDHVTAPTMRSIIAKGHGVM